MRIIAIRTIRDYWEEYPRAEQALKSWIQEMRQGEWSNSNELKEQFSHASILTGRRVIFNINGNRYRLIVDIEFRLQMIFVVWFGTHTEYDTIDAKNISYVRTDKK